MKFLLNKWKKTSAIKIRTPQGSGKWTKLIPKRTKARTSIEAQTKLETLNPTKMKEDADGKKENTWKERNP